MVVCVCHKATQLYCFVHKVPVCSECIGSQEHQICEVRRYSDWVISGDYDWPPGCRICEQIIQDTDRTIRLSCLHILHKSCLDSQLLSLPQTEPAKYACPVCSLPNGTSNVSLDANLIQACISAVPPKFSSISTVLSKPPIMNQELAIEVSSDAMQNSRRPGQDMIKAETGIHSNGLELSPRLSDPVAASSPKLSKVVSRKNSFRGERKISAAPSLDEDDAKKYNRKGFQRGGFLKSLLSIQSHTKVGLPVTSPRFRDDMDSPRKDDSQDSRKRRLRRSIASIDPKSILLFFASISCVGTMVLIYFTLSINSSEHCIVDSDQLW